MLAVRQGARCENAGRGWAAQVQDPDSGALRKAAVGSWWQSLRCLERGEGGLQELGPTAKHLWLLKLHVPISRSVEESASDLPLRPSCCSRCSLETPQPLGPARPWDPEVSQGKVKSDSMLELFV